MSIIINWTPKKERQVIQKLDLWIRNHNAAAGETIMQSDDCIIVAPLFISELVDDIIKPEWVDDDS